ncbi:MAG: WD40 repeat domain-containing protein [Anaerolineae bacterium]|nr:WD40 repeat domain-containing protein [Anaerolineae bacterium]
MKKLLMLVVLCVLLPSGASAQNGIDIREVLVLGDPDFHLRQWSPDGQFYALAQPDGVQVYTADHVERAFLPFPAGMVITWSEVTWRPDGGQAVVYLPISAREHYRQIWSLSPDRSTAVEWRLTDCLELMTWDSTYNQLAMCGTIYDMATGAPLLTHYYADEARLDAASAEHYPPARDYPGGPIYWHPDGSRFVSLYYQYSIPADHARIYGVFDAHTDELLFALPDSQIEHELSTFLWSPDGTRLTDGRHVWDAATGALLTVAADAASFQSGIYGFSQSVWSTDGRLLITLSTERYAIDHPPSALYWWDAETGETLAHLVTWRYLETIHWQNGRLLVEPLGSYRLTLDENGGVLAAEQQVSTITGSIAWNPDSTRLAAAGGGRVAFPLQVWNIAALRAGGEQVPQWTINTEWSVYDAAPQHLLPSGARVLWSQDGDSLVTVSTNYFPFRNYQVIEQWDAATGTHLATLLRVEDDPPVPIVEPSSDLQLWAQAFPTTRSGAEVIIAAASTGLAVTWMRVDDEAELLVPLWSPDGSLLATYSRFPATQVHVWGVTGEPPGRLVATIAEDGEVPCWSPDSRLLALEGPTIAVYDAGTGELVSDTGMAGYAWIVLAWSADSRLLVFEREGTLYLWDIAAHEIVAEVPLPARVRDLAWSPDNTLLAAALDDDTIRIWEIVMP